MKKAAIFLILILGISRVVLAQCAFQYQEILDQNCYGVYLQHQELTNERTGPISLYLKKGQRYALYLLNPSFRKVPELSWTDNTGESFKDYLIKHDRDSVYVWHKFTVAESAQYSFDLDYITKKPACVLMAIYLQNTDGYKPGLYSSLSDFRNKVPSQSLNAKISSYTEKADRDEVPHYKIDLTKDACDSLTQVFGFSDGHDLYVNIDEKKYKMTPRTKFALFEPIGSDFGYYEMVTTVVVVAGSVTTTMPVKVPKYMNLVTGETFDLKKKNLRNLLADNPELLAEFESEKKKSTLLKNYLVKYVDSLNDK